MSKHIAQINITDIKKYKGFQVDKALLLYKTQRDLFIDQSNEELCYGHILHVILTVELLSNEIIVKSFSFSFKINKI